MTHTTATTIPDDDLFAFCARHANPELWRTTIPLAVRVRCDGHKGLIATWTAIHWLIVLWSANGRQDFGVREIAAEAGVGRNELTGPTGYIQRLVDRGLLSIVGSRRIPGMPHPRPIYAIDLWDLEQQSIQLLPDLLRDRGVPPPPRPAPDPRQRSFFDQLDPPADAGTADLPPTGAAPEPRPSCTIRGQHPAPGTGTPAAETAAGHTAMGACGTDQAQMGANWPETGTAMTGNGTDRTAEHHPVHDSGTAMPNHGTSRPDSVTGAHAFGTDRPETMTDTARIRDIERTKEGKNERAREYVTHADVCALFQQITTQVTDQIQALFQHHTGNPAAREVPVTGPIPVAPPEEPALPADPLTLWQADRGQVSQRDQFQLELLAGQYDRATGGYGAYWLGRAILLADLCLEPKGQRATIPYLKRMLKRWHADQCWGSDLDADLPVVPAAATRAPTHDTAPVPSDDRPAADHPAVLRYITLTGQRPRAHQSDAIAATVTDLTVWEQLIQDWQNHGWNEKNIAGLLDRYRTQTGQTPPDLVRDSAIVLAPIGSEARGVWLARFRAAATPAAKRAVLEQFYAAYPDEHPQNDAKGTDHGTSPTG